MLVALLSPLPPSAQIRHLPVRPHTDLIIVVFYFLLPLVARCLSFNSSFLSLTLFVPLPLFLSLPPPPSKPTDVRIRVRGTTAIVQCNEKVTTRLPSAADAFARSSSSSSSPPSSLSALSPSSKADDGFSKDPEHKDAAAWLAHVIADSPYEPGSEQSIVSNPTTAEDRAKIKKAVGEHGMASIKKAVDTAFAQTDDKARGGRGGKKKSGASAVAAAAAAAAGRRKKVKPRFLNATNIYRKAGGR